MDSEVDNSTTSRIASLRFIAEFFNPYIQEVILVICIIGLIFNTLIIIVYAKHNMNSVTNSVLLAIATSDTLVLMLYLSKLVVEKCSGPFLPEADLSKGIVYFLLMNTAFQIGSHSATTAFTAILGLFRVVILHKRSTQQVISRKVLVWSLSLGCVLGLLMSIPYLALSEVTQENKGYWFQIMNRNVEATYFLIQGVIKVLTSLLMIVLSAMIIVILEKARKSHKFLASLHKPDKRESNRKSSALKIRQRSRQSHQTTVMLITVVVSFAIAEVPQGCLSIGIGIYNNLYEDDGFIHDYYVPLGDLMDITVLLNSSWNFLLYCLMSEQFRSEFLKVFNLGCCLSKKRVGSTNFQQSQTIGPLSNSQQRLNNE
ncbi:hypothetical protein Ciccas_014037 [Cichlidogyrus casuarinus]|uniref:G-protein coupled receptors family 1 profile domain-containing protein n=1 Tax=Cichlidogyrus casuarinus TaxID=1844966 RepID=A0ABD2PKS5_9PLAT